MFGFNLMVWFLIIRCLVLFGDLIFLFSINSEILTWQMITSLISLEDRFNFEFYYQRYKFNGTSIVEDHWLYCERKWQGKFVIRGKNLTW